MPGRTRLTIELVPSTAWCSNVRSIVTSTQWETCKRFTSTRSGRHCEICGGRGPKWPVECHERWEYDDVMRTQTLAGLIALCPDCHSVKHIGRTEAVGNFERAIRHLCWVNGWRRSDAEAYIDASFEIWAERSRHEWELDISFLETIGVPVPAGRLR